MVFCAEASDQVANKILLKAVQELALSVKAVVQKLGLCGEGAKLILPCSFQIAAYAHFVFDIYEFLRWVSLFMSSKHFSMFLYPL